MATLSFIVKGARIYNPIHSANVLHVCTCYSKTNAWIKKISTLQHSHMVGVQNGIWVMGLYRLASEEFDDKAQTDYRNIVLEIHLDGMHWCFQIDWRSRRWHVSGWLPWQESGGSEGELEQGELWPDPFSHLGVVSSKVGRDHPGQHLSEATTGSLTSTTTKNKNNV